MEYRQPPHTPPAITPLLAADEQTLWVGRPAPGFAKTYFSSLPFGLAWLAFSMFMTVSLLKQPGISPFPLIMLLGFDAIGLFLVFGVPLARASANNATTYALTNRRAYAIVRGTVTSAPATDGPSLVRLTAGGRRVSVTYAPSLTPTFLNIRTGEPGHIVIDGFKVSLESGADDQQRSPSPARRYTRYAVVLPGQTRPTGGSGAAAPVVFSDVADVEGLTAAIRQAGEGAN